MQDTAKRFMTAAAALIFAAGTGCADRSAVTNTNAGAEGGSAQTQKLGDEPVSKGRYIEEDIGSKDICSVSEFANAAVTGFPGCAPGGEKSRLVNWQFSGDGFKAGDLPAEVDTDNLYEACLSPEGDLFYSEFAEDSFTITYYLLKKDGTKKKFELKDGGMLLSCEFSADGRLFALTEDSRLVEINFDKMMEIPLCTFDRAVSKIDVAGNMIWASGSGGIAGYDLSKGSTVEADSVLNSLWKEHIAENGSDSTGDYDLFAGRENELYLVCQDGIFRYTVGGGMTEQIIDGLYTDLGNSTDPVKFGTLCMDGSFAVSFDNNSVKRYRYDPDAVNEFVSELKIYALKNNKTLSQAIRTFSNKHPEVKLDLEIGMKNGMTCEDAAKNLTAEMMSGRAPDVILLDGLDAEAFEAKGMLLDLSSIADKWEPGGELFKNIAEWNSEGGLYSVACRFGIPVLVSGSDGIDSVNGYKDVADLIEKQFRSGDTSWQNEDFTPESFSAESVGRIIGLYADKMLKDGKPDEAVIRELLESTKRINDLPHHGNFGNEEDYTENSALNTAMQAGTGLLKNSADIIYSSDALFYMTSVHDAVKETDIRYGIKDAPASFMPVCELGICSVSQKQDTAAEFIRTALSGEVQSAKTGDGLPVNRKGLESQLTANKEMTMMVMMYDGSGSELNFMVTPPDEKEQADIISYIESAENAVRIDTQTKNDIAEAGVSYLNGEITLDEAVSRIKSKLELRMKE